MEPCAYQQMVESDPVSACASGLACVCVGFGYLMPENYTTPWSGRSGADLKGRTVTGSVMCPVARPNASAMACRGCRSCQAHRKRSCEVKGVGVPAFGRRAVWHGAGVPTRKRTLAGGTYGADALSCGCVLKPTQARASLMFGQVSGSPRLAAGHLSAGMMRFQRHGQTFGRTELDA